ncbi:MAG: S8/S53 family peptidase [Alphaproteobacteria bacterium]
MKAREAQALLGGPPNWGDINVAHIDTGVTAHPALGSWVDVSIGKNYLEPQNPPIDPMDTHAMNAGHGTRTCGVLTGMLGGTFAGVAPKVPVVPYRVTDSVVLASGRVRANIASAILDAINSKACEVVTISLGIPQLSLFNHVLGEAVDQAYERGVIIVAAGGQIVDSICYPGKFYRTIGVGGYTGFVGNQGIYVSYGLDGSMNGFVDAWAPANPVWRPTVEHGSDGLDYGYGFGDGTSFATPHVSAAAAMWLYYREKDIATAYKEPWMRVEAFRLLLKRTAQDLKTLGYRGFDAMRPAGSTEKPPGKGNADASGRYVSGGLDILALLKADLPAHTDLTMASEAKKQWA